MADVVVTVPMGLWDEWIEEGELPGEEWGGMRSHFWIQPDSIPNIVSGDRVYVVAHGKLRGYAPLIEVERRCTLRPNRACLMRHNGAVAVTISEPIRGFQGWRYRSWRREDEQPFERWRIP